MTAVRSADPLHRAAPRAGGHPRRWLLAAVACIGVGLAAAPIAFSMFTRAPKGATMLADFRPFMTETRLQGFHQDIARIDAAVTDLHAEPAAQHSAAYASLDRQWPQINTTMTDLLDRVTANLPNYRAAAALPSFGLFPWFFVVPGLLIAGVAVVALRTGGRGPRIVLAALGIGLIAAPAVFQMFTRAPKGAQMMSDFRSIETTARVRQIQGYFATIASGQGAIRLDIAPHLDLDEHPAVRTLDADWVGILNDMTPMIGAMSDNVGNYQAIAALPSFDLFPWFFVAPGALVIAGALAAGRKEAA